MSSKFYITLILIALVMLSGCAERPAVPTAPVTLETLEVLTATPTATAMPTATATPTPETPVVEATATPTAEPTADPAYDAAWGTFLEVIYRCDAMPDLGDDLAAYPSLTEFEALPDGIEELTTDVPWQGWCEQQRPAKCLAKFEPQSLECEGTVCEAVVSVQAQGGLGNYQGELFVSRPPMYQDYYPFRLLRGTVELQGEQWIVTKMEVEVLTTSEMPPTPSTAASTSDYNAAWNTFLEVIYRCDAMPDLGDDLAVYPSLAEFDALPDGIEELTTDVPWQGWCEQHRIGKRLAQFESQNLECEDTVCEAVVTVLAQGGLGNYQGELFIARPPKYEDYGPFRLLQGTIELQGERWIVTKMEVEVLTPPTEEALPLDETAGLSQ